MQAALIIVTAAGLVSAGAAQAEARSTRPGETLGFVGGVITGALVGGPVGGFVGGLAGAYLGDSVQKAQRLRTTEEALAAEREHTSSLTARLAGSRRELAELYGLLETRPGIDAIGDGMGVDVYFRTGEAELAEANAVQLQELAGLVSRWPQLQVKIAGYADPRGDAGENERLSAARAESVSRLLEAGGVDGSRIETRAYGEGMSQAAEDDPDAYALERRVTVRLVPAQPPGQVAHRLD